jgi:hypothetical protein
MTQFGPVAETVEPSGQTFASAGHGVGVGGTGHSGNSQFGPVGATPEPPGQAFAIAGQIGGVGHTLIVQRMPSAEQLHWLQPSGEGKEAPTAYGVALAFAFFANTVPSQEQT